MIKILALAVLVLVSIATAEADGIALLKSQCASCHSLDGPAASSLTELKMRKGPDLFYAGNKYQRDWMVEWLQKPVRIRPAGMFYGEHIKQSEKRDMIDESTLKPHIALSVTDAESAADALMALKANSNLIDDKPFVAAGAPLGEMAFDKFYGCMACHLIEPGYGGLSGPEVYTAGRRLQPKFMRSFINNPQAWNPKSMMPNKHVPEANVDNLINFILDLAKEDWDAK
ncbi:c-type cytochrome [Mariprofundus erugo]|nr:c-type cytochrome [Mariprofundus erugo]